jgi:hypothetical protein
LKINIDVGVHPLLSAHRAVGAGQAVIPQHHVVPDHPEPSRLRTGTGPVCAFVSRIGTIGFPTRDREEWLLIEWSDGESEPIKYWLSTLA